MFNHVYVVIPTGKFSCQTPIQNCVEIVAPSNYKDPVKIAEYVNNKTAELFKDAAEMFYLVDSEVNLYELGENDDLVLVDTLKVSKLNAKLRAIFELEDMEEISNIVLVGYNAKEIVKALRRYAFNNNEYIVSDLIAVNPVSLLVNSSDLNNLSAAGKDASIAMYSDELAMCNRFIKVFDSYLSSLKVYVE